MRSQTVGHDLATKQQHSNNSVDVIAEIQGLKIQTDCAEVGRGNWSNPKAIYVENTCSGIQASLSTPRPVRENNIEGQTHWDTQRQSRCAKCKCQALMFANEWRWEWAWRAVRGTGFDHATAAVEAPEHSSMSPQGKLAPPEPSETRRQNWVMSHRRCQSCEEDWKPEVWYL